MPPIQLEALRRLLFFSVAEAATLLAASSDDRQSGVSERAWRYWESGEKPIPDDVVNRVLQLCAWRTDMVDQIMTRIDIARNSISEGSTMGVALVWYSSIDDWMTLPDREPVLWRPQCSVIAEVASRIDGIDLVTFDAPTYSKWLGRRKDNENMRSQWAATLQD